MNKVNPSRPHSPFPPRHPGSWIFAAFAALSLASCSLPQEVNGSLPDPDNVAQVQPGKSTKVDVTRLMGTPSSKSPFDPNIWYYASRRVGRDTLGDTSLIEQRVYVATFDAKGSLVSFEEHLNDAHEVAMIARSTPAPGRELSFIEQMLGNFGKIGGGKKKKGEDEDTGS